MGEWTITGSERMKNRPIALLVDALNSLGARIEYIEKEGYPPENFRQRLTRRRNQHERRSEQPVHIGINDDRSIYAKRLKNKTDRKHRFNAIHSYDDELNEGLWCSR